MNIGLLGGGQLGLMMVGIASGGVASIEDLQLLKARGSENIEGVICGRALYNGAIDLKAGLKILNS